MEELHYAQVEVRKGKNYTYKRNCIQLYSSSGNKGLPFPVDRSNLMNKDR